MRRAEDPLQQLLLPVRPCVHPVKLCRLCLSAYLQIQYLS